VRQEWYTAFFWVPLKINRVLRMAIILPDREEGLQLLIIEGRLRRESDFPQVKNGGRTAVIPSGIMSGLCRT